jgi:hypothetical protein
MIPVSGDHSAPMQADHFRAFDAVRLRLHVNGLDLGQFRRIGRNDKLAAFAMRHAMRSAECVQHPPPAHAMPGAQRVGRVVQTGVDHLAVARRNAVGYSASRFGDGNVMTGLRRGARNGKSDDAGPDHQNLHRGSSLSSSELLASLSSARATSREPVGSDGE